MSYKNYLYLYTNDAVKSVHNTKYCFKVIYSIVSKVNNKLSNKMGQDFLDIQYVMDFTFVYSQDNVQGRVADPDPCVLVGSGLNSKI